MSYFILVDNDLISVFFLGRDESALGDGWCWELVEHVTSYLQPFDMLGEIPGVFVGVKEINRVAGLFTKGMVT